MPGMNPGLVDSNPTLIAAFKAALLHQGLLVLALLAVLALTWVSVRQWLPSARSAAGQGPASVIRAGAAEPAARRLLRISFGVLWIFDGLLQAQPAMAAGMSSQVIKPSAGSSPAWVQHLVNWAATAWSFHPIQTAAAAVWIQAGIGIWLIAASSPRPSRLAGLVSAGWGLAVWVFGEAFGGIFAPGLTFLFGAPGAVLLYCAAGILVALPDRCWRTPAAGRRILEGMGLLFAGMAVLQAWPGRGFWPGTRHGKPAALASMAGSMSRTPQPRFLASWVSGFGSFAAAHGFAVNLLAVIALAVIGAGLLSRRPRMIRLALILMIAVCLADWVLVQDLGFLGGLGTDPGSMIPVVLVAIGGYLALIRSPAAAPGPVPAQTPAPAQTPGTVTDTAASGAGALKSHWRDRGQPARLARAFTAASLPAILAAWAAAVVLIGAVPMAMAQVSPNADPIIAQAIDGSSAPLNFPAPAFTLTDQNGRQVSLASLRGKVVLLTFLDPVCTSDCPLIAQEFRGAAQVLGAKSRDVEMVAIVANPLYREITYTRAFDRQERLAGVPNWLYLTGTLAQLRQAWREYDIAAEILAGGGMIAHPDVAYVIDQRGRTRAELNFDPGPGTASSMSSFAVELSDAAQQVLRSS
jgi:cytochrome oxidase Cu insertion factor (SCO1/SenC/PrrC family)